MKQPLLRQFRHSKRKTGNPEDDKRTLSVFNESETEDELEIRASFPQNIIVSSRYNIFNFLPKSLLEQFRRLANVYFLVLGIIACIGEYTNYYESAIEPAGILAPMIIVVLISVIKDGIEDVKRHQADNEINTRTAKRLNTDGQIEDILWKDIRVGDTIMIYADQELPADCVVLRSGGIQGQCCYVETAAIDGETNLKLKIPSTTLCSVTGDREVKLELSHDKTKLIGALDVLRCTIMAEAPNSSIHRFNAFVEPFNGAHGIGSDSSKQYALSEKNMLLRGSMLRATEWCVAAVIYTGADTKLSLNSKRPPSKLSSVDRIVNRTLLIAISTMLIVCIISMIFGIIWQEKDNDASYLCLHTDDLDSAYPKGGGCESSAPSSYLTIFTFATLYNNFVCISMYVSLEMVYLCQAYFVTNDIGLYDEESNTPAECHTSGMCADLGQVQYVLSDKTGTLTKNQMVVQQFSLTNKIFGEPLQNAPPSISVDTSKHSANDLMERPSRVSIVDMDFSPATDTTLLTQKTNFYPSLDLIQNVSIVTSKDSVDRLHSGQNDIIIDEVERKVFLNFIRVLVYCNTAMIMPDENGKQDISTYQELVDRLQAESPDEVALILSAAEHCKVLLEKRSNREIISKGIGRYSGGDPEATERVELLAVNEFDSDRKMMSVIVKLPDGKNMLLCKGADSSILKSCVTESNKFTNHCKAHIDYFANTGLRTLALSFRELTNSEVVSWMNDYLAASNTLVGRSEAMRDCAIKIEKDMTLLGAIGIEDELQDGVPDAISLMHNAGINVWMITGDKAETAIAIGKKCALIQPGKHVIEKVVNLSDEALRQRIIDLHSFVLSRRSQTESNTMQHTTTASLSSRKSAGPLKATGELALIVDGISLEGLWASDDLKTKFIDIVQNIPTVIACRVSPLQKAALVRMVKTAPGNPVTLGIGDGANDVGMIHESRVGVGISGKEGRHAANAADFAIAQFRFIVILLFEHGRFNYIRCSKLVLYSFFKNLLLVSMLFYYCTYCGFSGTIPLDSIVFSGYNFYLGLPILVLGATDFDISRKDVYRFPYEAYATGRLGEMLNLKNMAKWCSFAFVQGLILFIVAIRFISGPTYVETYDGYFKFSIYGTGLNSTSTGTGLGIYSEGFILYTCAVFAMQYKVVSMFITPNYIFWGLWILSFLGYFLFTYLYGLFPSLDWFNAMPEAMNTPQFWLAILLVPFMLVISDFTFEKVWSQFDPSSRDQLLEKLAEDNSNNSSGNSNATAGNNTNQPNTGFCLRPISQSSNTTATPTNSLQTTTSPLGHHVVSP